MSRCITAVYVSLHHCCACLAASLLCMSRCITAVHVSLHHCCACLPASLLCMSCCITAVYVLLHHCCASVLISGDQDCGDSFKKYPSNSLAFRGVHKTELHGRGSGVNLLHWSADTATTGLTLPHPWGYLGSSAGKRQCEGRQSFVLVGARRMFRSVPFTPHG